MALEVTSDIHSLNQDVSPIRPHTIPLHCASMGDDAEDDLVAKNFNSNGDGHDEWLTPKWITDTLGPFDLDPCSPGSRRPWDTAATHLAIEDDGLYAEWFGNVWCNPPYGKETFAWLAKLAAHGSGIALIFARTETIGFHAQVWGKADAVFFFKGRLKFHYIDGTSDQAANAPSCLVAYGVQSVEKLKHSGFSGRLVELQT